MVRKLYIGARLAHSIYLFTTIYNAQDAQEDKLPRAMYFFLFILQIETMSLENKNNQKGAITGCQF